MKKIARVLALVLVLATMATLFVGCNKAKPDGTDGNASGEKTVLRVEMFDRGQKFDNGDTAISNEATRWLQKEFGDPNNIQLEFVAFPRNEEVTKLNLMMSGKNAPDVVYTYDTAVFYRLAKDGGLVDITEKINNYPNLKAYAERGGDYGIYAGKRYGVNQPFKDKYSRDQAQFSSYIRKDWLDKLGLKVPTNAEELYEVLKAFRDAGPEKLGSNKVIPWGMSGYSFSRETWQQNSKTCTDSFLKPMTDEQFATLPELLKPGYKDGVQFLNKCFNEKLIDPDFALQKDFKLLWQEIASGNVGFWTMDYGAGTRKNQQITTLVDGNPNVEVLSVLPFANAEGKHLQTRRPTQSLCAFIPSFSKNVDAALKYLDFITTTENGQFLRCGEEGVHYGFKDGVRVAGEQNGYKKINWATEFYPVTDIPVPNDDAFFKMAGLDSSERMAALKIQANKNCLVDTYLRFEFDRPIEAAVKYMTILEEKYQDTLITAITASPDQFSSVYDKLVEEYMSVGGQEVLDEKIEAYRDMMKNKK